MFGSLYRTDGLVEIFVRRVVKLRTWITAVVVSGTAIAGTVIGATSASAATSVTVTASVTGGTTGWTISPGSTTDTALTVSYTNNSSSAFNTVYFSSPYLSNGGTSCSTSNTVCQLITGGAALTLDVDPSTPANTTVFLQFNSNSTNGRIILNSSGGSSGSSGSAPAPIVQEFGKPVAGTCDAAQPEGLNWAGVPSGRWANSWSQWMNGGQGGFVCTRTLIYSTSQSAWVVS
jgi:hypothetical protein